MSSGSPPRFPFIIDNEWQVAMPLNKVEDSGRIFTLDKGSSISLLVTGTIPHKSNSSSVRVPVWKLMSKIEKYLIEMMRVPRYFGLGLEVWYIFLIATYKIYFYWSASIKINSYAV